MRGLIQSCALENIEHFESEKLLESNCNKVAVKLIVTDESYGEQVA